MIQDANNILFYNVQAQYTLHGIGACPPHDNLDSLVKFDHPHKLKCKQLNEERFNMSYDEYDGVAIIVSYSWYKPQDLMPYLKYLKENNIKNILIFGNFYNVKVGMDNVINKYKARDIILKNLFNKYLLDYNIKDKDFLELKKEFNFEYISIWNGACKQGKCKIFYKDIPFTYDDHHYTITFSEFIAKENKQKIIDWVNK